jgi:hypothetical protein
MAEIPRREVTGTIDWISDTKILKGNFRSKTITLKEEGTEEEPVFHNIVGFSEKEINAVLANAKAGDKVTLIEEQNKQGYWNVKQIKFHERAPGEITKKEPVKTGITEEQFKDLVRRAVRITKELEEEQIYLDPHKVLEFLLENKITE